MDEAEQNFQPLGPEPANLEKAPELGLAEPPKGGEWLGNMPIDPDDPRFPVDLETVAKYREQYGADKVIVNGISRDPATGGYVHKHGVLGIWKFEM